VNKISIAVKENREVFKAKGNSSTVLPLGAGDKYLLKVRENARNFHVNGNCTGCSTCCKVCPVDNIKLESKQPKWGAACEQCMACIQWCPAHAIEYADKTAKRKRYQHPDIKLSDLI
jgi:MinD superfamily P-loop ATPase